MDTAFETMILSGNFVECHCGRVFVTEWRADQRSPVAVICAPPGLEELNVSRRQIAVQAQQLCSNGFDCFVMDYFGTGDSEGRDVDATFSNWNHSLESVLDWVLKQGYQRVILWGVRVGCLVITELLSRHPYSDVAGILFWQPLESGARWLATLKRLQLLSGKQSSSDRYRKIAGYQLSEALLGPINEFKWATYESLFQQYPLVICGVSDKGAVSDKFRQHFAFAQSVDVIDGNSFWSIPECPVNEQLNSHSLTRLKGFSGIEALL